MNGAWWRALRPAQWSKNLLVFAPAFLAHRIAEPAVWPAGLAAFAGLCLVASAGYLLNDLKDRAADTAHPVKRNRPVASGAIGPGAAAVLALVLAAGGIALGACAGTAGALAVAAYLAASALYTLALKRVPVLDVVWLAGLHVLRLGVGGAAAGVPLTHWLLLFAFCLFMSLALIKRYRALRNGEGAHGIYAAEEEHLLMAAGQAFAVGAVLVFGLYLNVPETARLYHRPLVLWGFCPVLAGWLLHLWRNAARDPGLEDPLLFALRDPVSLACAALSFALVLAAR